ncbi:hypothetical protein DPMN_040194 [Dreissena polymorpha]|uniref:Uncharacterized protein n=1 Tax=Dreissena polymorpha TaxID=45954 RepID=A0A9D4CWP6_DREPO|nr:hypothetical protein DPMN_040194 [Dreissena polymorpha]
MLSASDLPESYDCIGFCAYKCFQSRLTVPESDDCTDCCAFKCFQPLTYPRVTTTQTDVPTNAFSLRLTLE